MSSMDVAAVYLELYGRIPPLARRAVTGLDAAGLALRPVPGTNPIGWLVWHLARVEDHQVSGVRDADQLWLAGGWPERFGRAPDRNDLGFGHTAEQVASFDPVSAETLLDYLDAVHARTCDYLAGLRDADLDRVVDRSWDPPVTLGVRLVSVADDMLQHVGQALWVRGAIDDTWRFHA